MDPISHAVIGSAVAALVPQGAAPAVVWGTLLGAEVPDIDFVVRFWGGRAEYLRLHRGPTHGILSLVVEAGLITTALGFFFPVPNAWELFGWTLAGCLSHVLFDFGNDYGTQGLWPFSRRRVALDIFPIVDIWILGIIAMGWLISLLFAAAPTVVFPFVWSGLTLYAAIRLWFHRRSLRLVSQRFAAELQTPAAGPCGDGWTRQSISIHPMILSLRVWRYLVQVEGAWLVGAVRLLPDEVEEPGRFTSTMNAFGAASLQSAVVGLFANWVRRPRIEVQDHGRLHKVIWTDARYERHNFSPFTAYAWLDEELQLVDDGLAPQRPGSVKRQEVVDALRAEMGWRS